MATIPAAWPMYFGLEEEFSADDRRAILSHQLADWFTSKAGWSMLTENLSICFNRVSVQFDYENLRACCPSADLFAALDMQPAEAVACMGIAAYEVCFVQKQLPRLKPTKISVHIRNVTASNVDIKDLKASCLGKIVTITGSVIRMGPIKPKITYMSFVCGKCGAVCDQYLDEGRFSLPSRCSNAECRSRTFAPAYSDALAVDNQCMKLQQMQGAFRDCSNAGTVPRFVDCELSDSLVDSCQTGEIVAVCGIAKIRNPGNEQGIKSKFRGTGVSSIYIDVLSIDKPKAEDGTLALPNPEDKVFESSDFEIIARLYRELGEDVIAHFVNSLCPGIYGHHLVKAGLVLSLFGGQRKNAHRQGKVPIRGDIHVLMVGDPGMGKSQMLQATSKVAHHSVYVTGNTSSSAGLTAAVAKDGLSGEFCLEAGAIVMADQGICCIDEFDKMTTEYQSILEVMEQQEVSVAKAGLVASLPARTTVIAAANPNKGHYDSSMSLSDNLKLSPALLSRFDLIFLLLDQPDVDLDNVLSEHVMQLHSKAGKGERLAIKYRSPSKLLPSSQHQVRSSRLLDKIQSVSQLHTPPVPVELVRKCIVYARQYVNPVISSEARLILKNFYLELRNQNANCVGGVPITVRQLESMIRLAEARARLDLRERVTQEDAEDVVEVMRESLYSTIIDEFGSIKVGKSKKRGKNSEAKRFLTVLSQISRSQGRKMFSVSELYSLADDIQLQVEDMKALIEQLNFAGELLKKGNGMYSIAS